MIPGACPFGAATVSALGGISWLNETDEAGSSADTESSLITLPVVESGAGVDVVKCWQGFSIAQPEVGSAADSGAVGVIQFFFGSVVDTLSAVDTNLAGQVFVTTVTEVDFAVDTEFITYVSNVSSQDTGAAADSVSTFKGYAAADTYTLTALDTSTVKLVSYPLTVEVGAGVDISSVLLAGNVNHEDTKTTHALDTVSETAALYSSGVDVVYGVDSQAGSLTRRPATVETAYAVDQPNAAQTSAVVRVEAGSALDTSSNFAGYQPIVAETEVGSNVDTVSSIKGQQALRGDSLAAAESVTASDTALPAAAEAGAALDTESIARSVAATDPETGVAADTTSQFVSMRVIESGAALDVTYMLLYTNQNVTEYGQAADAISYTRSIADSVKEIENTITAALTTATRVTAAASVEIGLALDIVHGNKNNLAEVLTGSASETLAATDTVNAIRQYASLPVALGVPNLGTQVRIILENGMSTYIKVDNITQKTAWDQGLLPREAALNLEAGFQTLEDAADDIREELQVDPTTSYRSDATLVNAPNPGTTTRVDLNGLPTNDVELGTNLPTDVQLAQTKSPNFYKVTEVADKTKAGAAIVGVIIKDQKG